MAAVSLVWNTNMAGKKRSIEEWVTSSDGSNKIRPVLWTSLIKFHSGGVCL